MTLRKEDDVLRAALDRVAKRSRQDKLLAEVLTEDLALLKERHAKRLRDVDGVLVLFETIRASMKQGEKDAFFRAVLKGFQGITEASRTELRDIVRRYLERDALSPEESELRNEPKGLPR